MARPTPNNPTGAQKSYKMTPEAIKKLEEAFAIDATVGEACFYADISEPTYYNFVKKNPQLLEKFNRLRNKPVLKARKTVVDSLDDPNHAKWFLERKKKKEFGERKEVTGADGEPIKISWEK